MAAMEPVLISLAELRYRYWVAVERISKTYFPLIFGSTACPTKRLETRLHSTPANTTRGQAADERKRTCQLVVRERPEPRAT